MLLKIWYKPVASVAEEEWLIRYGGGGGGGKFEYNENKK